MKSSRIIWLGLFVIIGMAAVTATVWGLMDHQRAPAHGPQAAPPEGWQPEEKEHQAPVEVAWEKFPELLKTGTVVGGTSLHDGYVELEMKDGKRYSSTRPEGGSLPDLIEKYAPGAEIPIDME